jgi:hypothetical protein
MDEVVTSRFDREGWCPLMEFCPEGRRTREGVNSDDFVNMMRRNK